MGEMISDEQIACWEAGFNAALNNEPDRTAEGVSHPDWYADGYAQANAEANDPWLQARRGE